MPRRVLIAIGVDRVDGLMPLNAAASGAGKLAEWAKKRGVEVKLITDEDKNRSVTLAQISDVIQELVDSQTVEHLCIYFAGHGFVHSVTNEVWCLSHSGKKHGEVVDINSSVGYARMSGIPHVVFISDACRTPTRSIKFFSTGTPIFPATDDSAEVEVDEFYATKFGDAALEESPNIAIDCNGVFTKELIKAISDPVGSGLLISEVDGNQVITSRDLKNYLDTAVPVAAESIDIRYKQKPDLRVNTVLPKYLGQVSESPPLPDSDPSPDHPLPTAESENTDNDDLVVTEIPEEGAVEEQTPLEKRVEPRLTRKDIPQALVRRLINGRLTKNYSAPSESLPTDFQFTLRNVKLANLDLESQTILSKSTRRGVNVGLPEYNPTFPTLVETDAGLVPLIKIPNYNAVISTYMGEVSGYWYEPEHAYLKEAMGESAIRIRKEVYSGLQQGTLTYNFLEEKLADEIRQFKAFDPMLGVVASYIYAERGLRKKVASVRRYMRRDVPNFEIQDIWMLSKLFPDGVSNHADWPTLSPFPLLTRGWSYLKQLPQYDDVSWMEAALNPGIWTSFSPKKLAQLKPKNVTRWW